MLMSDVGGVVKRQWWAVLLAVGVTGAGVGAAAAFSRPGYEATGRVLLLPPTERLQPEADGNPYLGLPDGLTLTAALLAADVSGLDTQVELERLGLGADYTAAVVPGQGPVIAVLVTGGDEAKVIEQRDHLVALARQRLDEVQTAESVAEGQRITSRDITSDTAATTSHAAAVRAVLTAVAVGVGVGSMMVLGLDRRRARRDVAALAAEPSRVLHAPSADESTVGAEAAPMQPAQRSVASGDLADPLDGVGEAEGLDGHDGGDELAAPGRDVALVGAGVERASVAADRAAWSQGAAVVGAMRLALGAEIELRPRAVLPVVRRRTGRRALFATGRVVAGARRHPILRARRQGEPLLDGLLLWARRSRRTAVDRQRPPAEPPR